MNSPFSALVSPVFTPLTTAASITGLTSASDASTVISIPLSETSIEGSSTTEPRNERAALAIVSWLRRSGRSGKTSTSTVLSSLLSTGHPIAGSQSDHPAPSWPAPLVSCMYLRSACWRFRVGISHLSCPATSAADDRSPRGADH